LTDSRALSYENRLLLLLFFTFGFVFFDRLAITFLFPAISAELGLSNRHLGILSSVLALTWAVFGFAIPAACDVRGRRKSMLVAMVLAFSVLSALSGWISGFLSLLAIRALMGVAEGPVLPLSQALMASASASSRRGLNMGLLQGSAAGLFGSVLAPPIVVGISQLWGWRMAFYVSCLPGLLLAALIARYVRDADPSTQPDATTATVTSQSHSGFAWSEVWSGVAQVLKYRNIVICLAIGCVYIAWFIVIVSFAPTFLVKSRHFSSTTMSWVMSALGAAHVFWGFAVPWISDRIGRKPAMILFSGISVLAPLCLIGIESPVTLGIVLLLSYTGLGCFTIFMSTIPAETVPARHMATAIGLIMGVGEIAGGFVAPTAAGYAADLYGLQMPFWIAAAGAALACLLSLFLTETAPRQFATRDTLGAQ
jgi:MFS family permease